MAHVLARLRGFKSEDIKSILKADASKHAEKGLYLEHLWQNVDDAEEVVFLFRADDLLRAKQFIQKVHTQARKEDPKVNLPRMTFLQEK
jgi:hypothetical protein